jgi:magnesium transporter
VRGLATGHLALKDWRRVTHREFLAGLYMGLGYGFFVGLLTGVVFYSKFGVAFPAVVALGVLISMVVASTLGAVQPFLLTRFRLDPAVAVGPLVSTLTDLLSVTAYLSLAALALSLGWLVR